MSVCMSPNFLNPPEELSVPENSPAWILPIPLDITASWKRGTAEGPGAIISASHHIEYYDDELGLSPVKVIGGIATLPALELPVEPQVAMNAIESAAAEYISPDRTEWQETFKAWRKQLLRALQGYLQQQKQALDWLTKQIKHPGQRLYEHAQRLDELELRLSNAQKSLLRHRTAQLATLHARIQGLSPDQRLREIHLKLDRLNHANRKAIANLIDRNKNQLVNLSRALDAISPLATLGRGYALAQTQDGQIIRKATEVKINDQIVTRLGKGWLDCRIEKVHKE